MPDLSENSQHHSLCSAGRFSFAITGINITGALCNLIEQRQLNDYFYTRGCTMMAFNRLYGTLM